MTDHRSILSVTFLTGMASSSYITFSFSDTVSGLLFVSLVDAAMFIWVFYTINEKNDEVNTNLNPIH